MTNNTMAFPVAPGIEGMNSLALFLNASHPAGNWHFAKGTRFDQTLVSINFDDIADMDAMVDHGYPAVLPVEGKRGVSYPIKSLDRFMGE